MVHLAGMPDYSVVLRAVLCSIQRYLDLLMTINNFSKRSYIPLRVSVCPLVLISTNHTHPKIQGLTCCSVEFTSSRK
ncbi:unnamed protein product [Adineta steineri]|uniref:Uncharacterized protein n=1 Tax=Adineta steineri TaxID=433720 RepID=A0A820JU47_9BILA|nr:unnamed protein product [Adineta steineri]CAF4331272.1 unnamed protein product [Adineta steineri]